MNNKFMIQKKSLIKITIFLLMIFFPIFNAKAQVASAPGVPVRLIIPKIKVDAVIDSVGLTKQGAVGVPKGPKTAAWYNLGPRPGEAGSAIIDGHFGWKNGITAVFDNLSRLRKGDKIYIKDDQGVMMVFVVREVKKFGENDDVSSVFWANDTRAHLNLITCQGVWNKAKQSFSHRFVVFTDKVK